MGTDVTGTPTWSAEAAQERRVEAMHESALAIVKMVSAERDAIARESLAAIAGRQRAEGRARVLETALVKIRDTAGCYAEEGVVHVCASEVARAALATLDQES